MQLIIHDSLPLEEVQERFSDCFPGLKIEFYEESRSKRFPPSDSIVDPDTYIGEIRRQHYSGVFEIKSWFTVEKVEQDFKSLFGLNVQVFHKENHTWVLTNNNRTLREQMAKTQKINVPNLKRKEPSA